jgi:tetratricopeptide (TPR) repeat protein
MRALLLLPLLLACQKHTASPVGEPVNAASPADGTVVAANGGANNTVAAAWTFSDQPSQDQPVKIVAASPIGLTASDGTGLGLVGMHANAVIDAPLAFTELHLVFDNPRAQQIEGHFRITLPERASISRFAMLTNGQWQEGEVVERQAARRAYEDFLHRRQDPALLEQQAGNEFSARIFPIPPHGQKEVIIAYSEELLDQPYRIALAGLPQVGALDIRVNEGEKVSELHEKAFTPEKDFEVDAHRGTGVALRRDNFAVARVTPMAEVEKDATDSLFLLIDTSASRTLGKAADLALAKDLVKRLGDAPVAIWAYDQTTMLVDEGKASGIDWKKLEARRSLGASDLEQALATVAKHDKKYRRGLVMSDGVVTAGLTALADAAKATGAQRVDCIAVGGIRDRDALQRLTFGGGLVVDGALPTTAIAVKLNHKTRSGIKVEVPGADWVWPETLDNVQPGDQIVVYADLAEGKPFSMSLDGKPIAAGTMKKAERPLVERAWVGARIKKLLDQRERTGDKDMREALNKQVVELSTKFRVLCPLTALLVLETEQDYARFKIDRKALAGILSVENGTVVVKGRTGPVVVKNTTRPVEKPKLPDTNTRPTGSAPGNQGIGAAGAGGAASQGARGRAVAADDMDGAPMAKSARAPADEEAEKDVMADKKSDSRAEAPMRDVASESPRPSVAAAPPPAPRAEPSEARRESLAQPRESRPAQVVTEQKTEQVSPYTGQFRTIMNSLRHKDKEAALTQADGWWQSSPGDVMALVALGEALEGNSDADEAGRAYGSLIDLFPSRADLRRFAGERLERLKTESALKLAADSYAKAVEQRPDHPQSHRLLAYTLLKMNQPEKAFDVLEKGAAQRYPDGRFAGVDQIFAEDLGIAAQAWIKVQPERKEEIYKRLAKDGGRRETSPSLRFVLSWETDANDVDFHIFDNQGGHAFYSSQELPSGGELYEDVTTGYGPECFTIRGKPHAAPYKLQAHYYSRGPMGYGMGSLQIVQHDGQGNLKFDDRPFVVMQDHAFLELGTVGKSL